MKKIIVRLHRLDIACPASTQLNDITNSYLLWRLAPAPFSLCRHAINPHVFPSPELSDMIPDFVCRRSLRTFLRARVEVTGIRNPPLHVYTINPLYIKGLFEARPPATYPVGNLRNRKKSVS